MSVKVGILIDVQSAAVPGSVYEQAAAVGFEAVRATPVGSRLPDIELVTVSAAAHPVGSPDLAAVALRELVDSGVVAVVGPSVADNALACVPVADELQVPCINWSGSERARSEWMFHYQVGSLEDEPYVIADYMARQGWRRVALIREDSIIGREYASFFVDAAVVHGLEVVATIDLDVPGDNAVAAAAAVDGVAPDAVVFLRFPSVFGFAVAMRDRSLPMVANSALLAGHFDSALANALDGWSYIDVFDEDNVECRRLLGRFPDAHALPLLALYDMTRLIAFGLMHAPTLDPAGLQVGLERVKRIPAALGAPRTIAGFGPWKRAALEGDYLVVRQWKDGRSILIRA
jgi:branched-chain amino acid transport system substrate-binding protein